MRDHETAFLDALGIDWRWDEAAARARCTCAKGDTILDVVMKVERLDFERAKLRVAELIGRHDLIKMKNAERHQAMDAKSLLRPPPDQRDDALIRAYVGHRLGVAPDQVPTPATAHGRLARAPLL